METQAPNAVFEERRPKESSENSRVIRPKGE